MGGHRHLWPPEKELEFSKGLGGGGGGGGGGCHKVNLFCGGMDIFWNYTMTHTSAHV